MAFFKLRSWSCPIWAGVVALACWSGVSAIDARCLAASEEETVDAPDYCADFSAFAARFVRPAFPENAPADEQKNWYALKKTCGRDLIKLSLAKWPAFDSKPDDVADDAWDKFIAAEELSRFKIAESVFDENHGGTLIKKYYSTDFEPDKIIALYRNAIEQTELVRDGITVLTKSEEWKSARRSELDFFLQDFSRWLAPYCRASLEKLPPVDTFASNPDLFLSAADLLEFAVEFIPDDEKFVEVLNGIERLIQEPKAVEIRVFHGRYEGMDLVSRDVIFKRYCDRIARISEKRSVQSLKPVLAEGLFYVDRQVERFEHGSLPQWGAKNPEQKDYFYVMWPKSGPEKERPLYVVLHSAGDYGHWSYSHSREIDIYRVPDDFYGLFLDCYDNRETDWWWGGRQANQPEITDELAERSTAESTPVEKRVLDEIAWTVEKFNIDVNRVYLCGNSMGASGTLGLGMAHGDVFAAIKANVPAGVWHAYDRLQLGAEDAPEGLPDPPVCLDYSSPIDDWSLYHEALFKGVEKRKYSYIAYWGNFGHANKDEIVSQYNDLFKTFDWTSVRKNEAYAVFTNASCESEIPWPERPENAPSGQRGAYFRWENRADEADVFETTLRLASAEELQTKLFEVPTTATADVSVRRLQNFKVSPNETILWSFGEKSGKAPADKLGLVTIPELTISVEPCVLKLSRE